MPSVNSTSISIKIIAFCSILILSSLAGEPALAQKKGLNFQHIGTDEGLSQNSVNCMIKDSRGYMWIGTRDGLNKYDGYTFTIYKHDPRNSATISHSHINDIYEDNKGDIWIATYRGLDKLDRQNNSFIHYPLAKPFLHVRTIFQDSKQNYWIGTTEGLYLYKPEDGSYKVYTNDPKDSRSPNSIFNDIVNVIKEDQQGKLWILTSKSLEVFDPETQKFKFFRNDPKDSSTVIGNNFRAFLIDSKDNIWVGARGAGLSLYNRKTGTFINYYEDSENPEGLADNYITSLIEGNDGKIWIGTENEGVNVFDPATETFSVHKNSPQDPFSLREDQVNSMYKDDVGNIWVGTWNKGLSWIPRHGEKFIHMKSISNNENSLNNNIINSIATDEKGNWWIGTKQGGINIYNPKKNTFTFLRHKPENPNSLSKDNVNAILPLNKDTILLGYQNGGLDFYNKITGEFTNYKPQPEKDTVKRSRHIGGTTINCLLKDSYGDIWAGSWGGGLNQYTKRKGLFTVHKNHSSDSLHEISNNVIFTLFEDKEKQLWVGTEKGLNKYNRKDGSFTQFFHDPQNPKSLSHSTIYTIFQDHKGRLWIGTAGGLNLFNKEHNTFTSFTEKDGLPNDVIQAILADKEGNLWISTFNGITKFDPEAKKVIRNYSTADGLQGKEFHMNACMITNKGQMIFGGANGLNIFYPDSIKENPYIPPVEITNIEIFNKPVIIGGEDSPLQQHISETKEITLPYYLSVFTLEFAGLNFFLPQKNQYAYKLDGFDKEWNYVGNKRTATYTNLDPGKYTFRVKGSNNDGIWNEEGTALSLIITPPYWATWWFRSLVALSIIGGAFTFYRVRINAIKEQKAELENQVKERTAEVVLQKEELQAQANVLLQTNDHLRESQEEIALQRDHLEKINEQVMSSIQYAQTIQRAILPSSQKIAQVFPEHFILYRPKDVVSGDFYWFAHLPKEESGLPTDISFMAVVDCTGHGVPGAFMSIIGSTILNEIVNQKQITDPATILELLDEGIKQAVEKTEGMNTAGMDVCLCQFIKGEGNEMKIIFSGAKRNLLFVRKGSSTTEKLLANRRSIGSNVSKPFTNQELILESGSMLYLTSDGYVDQNNPEREKLGSIKFDKTIKRCANQDCAEQKQGFDYALDEHQKSSEQRDDITLVGIRI